MEAKIDNYNTWIKGCNEDTIKSRIVELLEQSGFTILNYIDHHFEPQGYTGLWLLAESHCALHTFPEENKSYLELSSCNETMYLDFKRNIGSYFDLAISSV
ncbi:MAG: S-adenosylmethionine decarboxylase [Cyclobacteriaceae bacterium]